MDKAKEKLVTDNMAFVGHMVRKFGWTGIEYEELVEAGNFALVKAAEKFDAGRGACFLTFAGKCITNEILMEYRKQQKEKMVVVVSMDQHAYESENGGNSLFFSDMLSCEENGYRLVEERDWRMSIEKTAVLTEKERRVVFLLMNGYTQSAAGKEIGASQSYVSRLIKRASGKLSGAQLAGGG